jgi:hypothetical protein
LCLQRSVSETGIDQGQRYTQTAGAIIIRVKAVVDTTGLAGTVAIDIVGDQDLVFGIDVFRVNRGAVKERGIPEVADDPFVVYFSR